MKETELAQAYPNLFIQIIREHWGIWVKRGNRSGEAICYHQPTEAELDIMNAEAGKALQEGWFYCTKCQKAYPRTEYGYFYFAGNYCAKCKDEDPEKFKRAMNESYN